jgi:hypothetical protein
LKRVAAFGALLFLATSFGASAQNNPDLGSQGGGAGSSAPGIASQPGGAGSSNPGLAHQGGDDATLEISPQTGIRPPAPSSDEIPSNREFRPGDDTASNNREFRPGEQDRGGQIGNSKSCLGITVNYTSYCFKGAEEHGLEITSIDRNSPAETAGLRATGENGGMISAAETASAFLGPLQLLTNGFLEKAAQGNRGDLIVAVDDQRIRSQADFNDALAKARPGDTIYLTVIRPLHATDQKGGMTMDHATMKIAVKVGKWQPGSADSCADSTTASAQPPATN